MSTAREGGGALKRILLGRAIASSKAEHQLLPKILALPVFSSDPLSSNAYATEEMMLVLVTAGAGALALKIPIALAIAGLLASWSPPTARRCAPTRAAAGRTSSRARTWGPFPG